MSYNDDLISFVDWIHNRLVYKYKEKENSEIFYKLEQIKSALQPKIFDLDIEQNTLDRILSKYYADFNLDSCDNLNIGYTDAQRDSIRQSILGISKEIFQIAKINETSSAVSK